MYYRLKQRDLDGRTTYSTAAFAPVLAAPSVTLYPNPAQEQTTLDLTTLPAGSYKVTILDLSGRQVQAHTLAGGQTHLLEVSNLSSGTYLILIANGTAKFTQRLSKQ